MSVGDPKPEERVASLEDVLVQEYNLRVIKPPKPLALPDNVDFSALEKLGIKEEEARDLAEEIVNFENSPIIIDQFNRDHTARRAWRKQVENRYGQDALSFIKTNKLRVNSFTFINLFFVNVGIRVRKIKPSELLLEKVNSIRKRYSEIVRGYADMDVEEKIETARKLDLLFAEVLELLETR